MESSQLLKPSSKKEIRPDNNSKKIKNKKVILML
jgi:hypothetical protein